MRTAMAKKGGEKEVDNLELHHKMYERRMRILKEREEHPTSDQEDGASDTERIKKEPTEESDE